SFWTSAAVFFFSQAVKERTLISASRWKSFFSDEWEDSIRNDLFLGSGSRIRARGLGSRGALGGCGRFGGGGRHGILAGGLILEQLCSAPEAFGGGLG